MALPDVLLHQREPHALLAALWGGGRFPHALLIEGTPGSGKRTLAGMAAAMLLCRGEGDLPCGVCLSCRKLKSGNHPDLTVVEGDGKTKSIGVERIRALRADAYVSPHESARRVFLLPQAHTLTSQAQNALLKLIEEPPAPDYFILTAPARGGLLETIRSRVTTIPMRELNEAQRADALSLLRPELDPALAAAAARGAATVGLALEALEDDDARRRFDDARTLLARALARDRYEMMRIFSGYERDREAFLRLLEALRAECVAGLSGGDALQRLRIAGIMEETARCARQNVGLALLSAVCAGRLAG